jgi:hypothetical protein
LMLLAVPACFLLLTPIAALHLFSAREPPIAGVDLHLLRGDTCGSLDISGAQRRPAVALARVRRACAFVALRLLFPLTARP